MSYRTVLVHVDKSVNAVQRFKLAAAIAENEDAHLVGAAMTGVSRFIYQAESMNGADTGLAEFLKSPVALLRERAKDALDDFERIAQASGRPFERQLVDDEAGGGMSLLARYSDLVVVGQMNRDDPATKLIPDLPEYVALSSGRPVLVVPYAGRFEGTGTRALVAWDGSVSATRAVTSAIPLLKRARIVEVVVFNAGSEQGVHGEQPGADIALYLARHGVKVEVSREETIMDIGNALLCMATDRGFDLIVMGCYGHTRFREILLGGATRTVLETMTVPVLMSH
jgi:nucleotide-binding universal stress UspA family protein